MAKKDSIHIPAGYVANLTTDAVSSGSYVRVEVGDENSYSPVTVPVSSNLLVGPFNEPRNYVLQMDAGNIVVVSIVASGVFTGVDEAAYRPIVDVIVSYAADGAIDLTAGIKKITKSASLAALTLAAPTAAQEGMVMYIVSNTAKAHTVTATGLFDDGVTGGSKNTATFAAFIGASMTIMAINLKWTIISLNAVTVA